MPPLVRSRDTVEVCRRGTRRGLIADRGIARFQITAGEMGRQPTQFNKTIAGMMVEWRHEDR